MIVAFLPLLMALGVEGKVEGWEPCGTPPGCYCKAPVLYQIQCLDVPHFPTFDEHLKPGVLTFTFFQSPITEVEPFDEEEWPSLNVLNFVETFNLSCDLIATLQRPGLRIYSHCIGCSPRIPEPSSTNMANVSLAITGYGLALIALVSAGYLFYRQRRGNGAVTAVPYQCKENEDF